MFLFPLIALVVIRYVRSELTGRRLVCWLGVLLAFQLLISTEFTVMVTLALLVCLCLNGAFINIRLGLDPVPTPTTKLADFIQGKGLTCDPPPAGYTQHGFASEALGVPGGTYPYYAP